MYANSIRISVSVATVELAGSDGGAQLTCAEQGVYLDGKAGSRSSGNAEGGTTENTQGPVRVPAATCLNSAYWCRQFRSAYVSDIFRCSFSDRNGRR